MIWKDNKDLKEKENLHLYRLDIKKPYDEEIASKARTLDDIIEQLLPYYLFVISLVNDRRYIIEEL